jgi:hypothetical protein
MSNMRALYWRGEDDSSAQFQAKLQPCYPSYTIT